jgi:hypothetical protein
MFVTGSVHVEVAVDVEEVDVVVVQVIAVLAGGAPQEVRPKKAMTATKNRRRFTEPLSSLFEIPETCSSASTLIPKIGIIS